mmetsp:Transcript_3118/g.5301  ORF Transcript_3118/g.5301 Transcript_3118/m.5301 type:complete len:179 (-) Transcript_3118:232-768(-)
MANEHPRIWCVLSLFAVGLAQQPMLCGITLPLYSVHFSSNVAFGILDYVACALCLVGLMIAWVADNQLRDYVIENKRRAKDGRARIKLLDTGLWSFSRHPNYFGEQLWWWAFALFGVSAGDWWVLAGTLFNSVVFWKVTLLTEERMLSTWSPDRALLYKAYIRTTSVWMPLPSKTATS